MRKILAVNREDPGNTGYDGVHMHSQCWGGESGSLDLLASQLSLIMSSQSSERPCLKK